MKSILKRFSVVAFVGISGAAAAIAGACGDTPPVTTVPTGGVVGPDGTATQPGQQWTLPSGGGMDASMPKMNDSAAKSYVGGIQAFMAGDLPTAKKMFTDATTADPTAFQAFYSLGVVNERLKSYDDAAAAYRQSYTLQASYEYPIVAAGMLKAKRGQLSEADTFLTQKAGELPKSGNVRAALAEVKSLEKNTTDAQNLAQEAIKIDPTCKSAMVVIARDHYRNRRINLALYALTAILDGFEPVSENPPRDKDNAEALLLRGMIYKEQDNRVGAIDQFQKAYNKRPDLVEARVELARFLLESGDAIQAQPLLEGALRFDVDNEMAQLLLGDCYRLQGRFADAKTRFDYVAAKDSSLPMVHYDLGLLYLFAPTISGMTPLQQVDAASAELKKYQDLRDKNVVDDSDELLKRANIKQATLKAQQAPATPPADVPMPSASATPAK